MIVLLLPNKRDWSQEEKERANLPRIRHHYMPPCHFDQPGNLIQIKKMLFEFGQKAIYISSLIWYYAQAKEKDVLRKLNSCQWQSEEKQIWPSILGTCMVTKSTLVVTREEPNSKMVFLHTPTFSVQPICLLPFPFSNWKKLNSVWSKKEKNSNSLKNFRMGRLNPNWFWFTL